MTTPHVTELPLKLEPVEPDPFIEAPPSPSGPTARRAEREERRRRLDLVLRLMRVRSGDTLTRDGARNGRPAPRTKRP
jgi:hypothetical protein